MPILSALQCHPLDTRITAIMRTEFDIVDANSPLDALLTLLRHEGGHAIPVMARERLAALITMEDLTEYAWTPPIPARAPLPGPRVCFIF